MKKILLILIIISTCFGCKKVDNENSKFNTGTYTGEKTIYYPDSHHESLDTITIKFDSNSYTYSGSDALDFGRGNYVVETNSIEFNDDEARNALYSWEWILGGTHTFRMMGDSLVLNQNGLHLKVTCRLKKYPNN
jgi:hypothetical protein